jgi:hypothetical protein
MSSNPQLRPQTPAGELSMAPPSNPGYPMAQMSSMGSGVSPAPYPQASVSQFQQHAPGTHPTAPSSSRWVWWVVGLLALGAAAGAVLALVMR